MKHIFPPYPYPTFLRIVVLPYRTGTDTHTLKHVPVLLSLKFVSMISCLLYRNVHTLKAKYISSE